MAFKTEMKYTPEKVTTLTNHYIQNAKYNGNDEVQVKHFRISRSQVQEAYKNASNRIEATDTTNGNKVIDLVDTFLGNNSAKSDLLSKLDSALRSSDDLSKTVEFVAELLAVNDLSDEELCEAEIVALENRANELRQQNRDNMYPGPLTM